MKLRCIYFLIFCTSISATYGQENEILEEYFSPSISSLVIPVNAIEGFVSTSFGNIKYLPQRQINSGYEIEKDFFVNNNVQLNYGVLRNFNIGLEYNRSYVKSTFADADGFVSDYANNNIGLRIRWRPIKLSKSDDITLHHYAQYALDDYLPEKGVTLGSAFIWSKRWSYNFLTMLFYQIQALPSMYGYSKRPIQNSVYALAGYAINSELMVFSFVNYYNLLSDLETADNYTETDFNINLGLGVQYRLLNRLTISGYLNPSLQSKKADSYFMSNISLRYFTF